MVFIPKYRRKALYKELRRHVGTLFRSLAEQRDCRIEEGHLQADHVHMMISIPPKCSVAQVIGYIKGKSAIHIARTFTGKPRNFVGQHFRRQTTHSFRHLQEDGQAPVGASPSAPAPDRGQLVHNSTDSPTARRQGNDRTWGG